MKSRLPTSITGWYRFQTEARHLIESLEDNPPETYRAYPPCPHRCGHDLCWLDRQWDACPNCNGPLPLTLQVDNNFEPLA